MDERVQRQKAERDVREGGLFLLGGVLVTAVTYALSSGGGTYFITWGAILYGGAQFVRGLAAQARLGPHDTEPSAASQPPVSGWADVSAAEASPEPLEPQAPTPAWILWTIAAAVLFLLAAVLLQISSGKLAW